MMAEGGAEDAPLLGSGESASPGECSPEAHTPSPGGCHHSTWNPSPSSENLSHQAWAPTQDSQSVVVASPPQPWPPDTWAGEYRTPRLPQPPPPALVDTLQLPQDLSPKLVHSQSSMDSGCECDAEGGTGDATPAETPVTVPSLGTTQQMPTTQNQTQWQTQNGISQVREAGGSSVSEPPGLSPLSPSQPGAASIPSSPGAFNQVVVLVTPQGSQARTHPYLEGGGPRPPGCFCDRGEASMVLPRPLDYHQDIHPKVTFRIDDDDDDDDEDDDRCSDGMGASGTMNVIETASLSGSEPGEDFKEQLMNLAASHFPRVPSYSRTGVLSSSSSTASMPMCRICHHPQGDGLDMLISPCRCAGTMQFIHQGCLNKWLEVKRSKKAPACELCNYQFHRHKKFRLHHWQLPTCSRADKILHTIFLICLIIMAACATITIICFRQFKKVCSCLGLDRVVPKPPDSDIQQLTTSEVTTLTCGVLFFVAFFVAMYVEVKARNTLYRIFTRFLYLNQTWHIAEYDRRKDSQYSHVKDSQFSHAPV